MLLFNNFLRHLTYIKFTRSNFNQLCCKNIRCLSTIKSLQCNDFRNKTEQFSFHNVQNVDPDTFGTLTNNVGINDKLDKLPPEADDKIEYDKDKFNKRLYITEYHQIIQDLVKQHKVYNFNLFFNLLFYLSIFMLGFFLC